MIFYVTDYLGLYVAEVHYNIGKNEKKINVFQLNRQSCGGEESPLWRDGRRGLQILQLPVDGVRLCGESLAPGNSQASSARDSPGRLKHAGWNPRIWGEYHSIQCHCCGLDMGWVCSPRVHMREACCFKE